MGMSWPYLGAFAVGAVITWALGFIPLMTYLLVSTAVYYASVRLHPMRPCWVCEGGGRNKGLIVSYASRPCDTCHGSGRRPRLGARIFRVEM